MHKKILFLLLAALLLAGASQTAQAALTAVGPVSPATGYFPVWYQDATRTVELCLSKTPSPGGAPMCSLLPVPGVFDPALPVVFPLNFPDESFYVTADASIVDVPAGIDVRFVSALEAAFSGGAVVNGDQITFARVRVFAQLPTVGTYTITHPYGVETFVVDTVGVAREIQFTRDIGIGAPGNFTGALAGDVWPFLVRSLSEGGAAAPIVIGAETFLGDPNVTQFVTGSRFATNFVHIVGPGIDLTTNQFAISGKVFGGVLPVPLTVDRATYSRTAGGASTVEVFAASDPVAALSFRETVIAGVETPLIADPATGAAYKQYAPAALPGSLIVTATTASAPPATLGRRVVDMVMISKATYSFDAKELTIEASSSDQLAPLPVLTAVGWGVLSVPTLSVGIMQIVVPNVLEPPARVTVLSSAGGSDTEPVIVPMKTPPVPVLDVAVVTPASLSFANQLINTTSAVQSVIVSNTGTGPLLITSIVRSGANPGQFLQTNTCPIGGAGLASGATCTINATFTPTTAGAKNASIAINVAAPAASKTVTLTGTGLAPLAPISVVTPTALSFANQTINGTSAVQTVTVRNTGTAPLIITGVIKGGANAGQFQVNNGCQIGGAGLAPGTSCTIKVKFKPTVVGVRNASIAVNVAAPAASQTVTLTGTGIL